MCVVLKRISSEVSKLNGQHTYLNHFTPYGDIFSMILYNSTRWTFSHEVQCEITLCTVGLENIVI